VRLVFQNNLQAKHKPHKVFAGGRPPYQIPALMALAEQRALDAKVRANLKRQIAIAALDRFVSLQKQEFSKVVATWTTLLTEL
jgi:hypothetical protein